MERVLALQELDKVETEEDVLACVSNVSGVCSACSYIGCGSVVDE
jgi:hypothetical protein